MKPELLAPGGSFHSAYYAFQAGADGVYLGMREFSARQAAVNFTPEQLRRLLGVARERGGRVYLALNTVVREQELPRAAETLNWAQELGLDGVIVQDLGVAELARRHFPSLVLHASTQMAVHNAAGLRVARELGFRRVILSRELDLDTIRGLRQGNPDIELEVFIHGALCYSFSGLCLASWALTGRSGNRGDCAQICRSLFRSEDGEGYFFSSRDLYLGHSRTRAGRAGDRRPQDRGPDEEPGVRVPHGEAVPGHPGPGGGAGRRGAGRAGAPLGAGLRPGADPGLTGAIPAGSG